MTLLCGHTGDPALNAVYSSGLVPGAGGTVIIEERSQNCYCVLSSDSARHSNPIAPRYHPVCGFLQPHSAQWGGVQRLKRQDLAQGHTALRAGVHTEMSSRRLWVRCSSHHNTKSMVPSKGYLAVSGDTVGHHVWEEVLLAPSGERSEMLLNILPCTGQPRSIERSSLNVSSQQP